MSDLRELGNRQETLKQAITKLGQFPARVHGLSEEDRASRLLELNDELQLVQAEIEREATATNARHISQVYGTAPVAENAQAELKRAEAELAKVVASFESQTRCRRSPGSPRLRSLNLPSCEGLGVSS
jgi:hypothetical protein